MSPGGAGDCTFHPLRADRKEGGCNGSAMLLIVSKANKLRDFRPTGMLLLAAWSTDGWLPSGHALRMGLDLGLHHALEKLAEPSRKRRSSEEERDLGMPAIMALCARSDLLYHWQSFPLASGYACIGLITSETCLSLYLERPAADLTKDEFGYWPPNCPQRRNLHQTLPRPPESSNGLSY